MGTVAPPPAGAEVAGALRSLAARLAAGGHHLPAIKCHVALLAQSQLPSDEAATRLALANLLLQHTLNAADALKHLQRAELLAMPLPGEPLLKCQVLAALGAAHQALGEADFQRRAFAKGLELCRKQTAPGNNAGAGVKRSLAEWAVYFHLHSAESLLSADGDAAKAAEQAQAAAQVAEQAGLPEHQALCLLFQQQLCILQCDRQGADAAAAAIKPLLLAQQAAAAGGGGGSMLAQLQLHFRLLQVVLGVSLGHFQELAPAHEASPPIITELEALVSSLGPQQPPQPQQPQQPQQPCSGYSWLPPAGVAALVQLLAAVLLTPSGRVKPALVHISRGLQLLEPELAAHLQPAAAASAGGAAAPGPGEAGLDHTSRARVRSCLALRVLLLQARQQLHLLASDFAAARDDAAQAIQLLAAFPHALGPLRPAAHLQAGLYAQAVGAHGQALAHFRKVAAAAAPGAAHLAARGRCLAALACLAQDAPNAVSAARELLGTSADSDAALGYTERALGHIAAGTLTLAAPDARAGGEQAHKLSSDERADAKQRLSKALKLAHGRLQNHALVAQILLLMAPLQVAAADTSGALAMVTSSITLSKGAGDLHAQVAGLGAMQGLFEGSRQADKAAQNRNYLARKHEELSGRMQAAEADAHAHALVLGWDV